MLSNSDIILVAVAIVGLHMSAYYIYSMIIKDASIVDIGWGLGFVLIAWSYCLLIEPNDAAYKLLSLLVSIWGLRLALHIFLRKKGKGEDFRYANWRQQWGKTFWWRSFLQVFMLQGVMMLVIASIILVAAINNGSYELRWWVWLGATIWLVGFYFEAVGDWQLKKFLQKRAKGNTSKKKSKKTKQIMTSGVWRYTRHPNYFGEVTLWWGLWLMVVGLSWGWIAIISPLTITYLLLKVSGIPLLEAKYEGNKEFEKYKMKTSAFFPLPPKKK